LSGEHLSLGRTKGAQHEESATKSTQRGRQFRWVETKTLDSKAHPKCRLPSACYSASVGGKGKKKKKKEEARG